MADDDYVTLQSQDHQEFKVEVGVVKMSKTIENLIEDAGVDLPIPLPNVNGKILGKIIHYCKHHTENPDLDNKDEDVSSGTYVISEWDQEFCQVDHPTLFELILAANYLDIQSLLDVTCKTVAKIIRGKTPEEIRKIFNIVNDFTPEEEDQIRK